jgi:dihydrofolate synthase/folylpolyglutamate synthase
MRFNSLGDWLSWQETLHPSEIELGLERIASVFNTLHPEPEFPYIITVAGTNGKGSSVAMLDAIYRAAGYQVGKYTSPHLFHYNERISIDGQAVEDEVICHAFERIEQARGNTSLTYFEFGTLAAIDIFLQHELDVIILEVGLGGRLDAVNILDADIGLITAISLDHTQWLGDDINAIAREKAGIMRANKPVVSSANNAIAVLKQCAEDVAAKLYQSETDYRFSKQDNDAWSWQYRGQQRTALPMPALFGEHQLKNAAGVLMVIELMAQQLPVSQQAIREGLMTVKLAGRFQLFPGEPTCIFDVAHNPDAVRQLAQQLQQYPCQGRTLAVLGMLADKDSKAALEEIFNNIDEWFIAPVLTPRSESAENLSGVLGSYNASVSVTSCPSIRDAIEKARKKANPGDRIVVFGSFYTVAEAMPQTL